MLSTFLILDGLAMFASAHMLMTNPMPYGASTLRNGPLDKMGLDFPCQLRDDAYTIGEASNIYPQGSTQTLKFKGQAVHGGGSCQLSVTTDLQPSKSSVWRVIKSIEGGCPAKNQTGNMGDSADAPDPYTYDFTVPSELAAGKYSIAWTWFNRVGDREMYMNCAPMTVTGSGGSTSYLSSLPIMFEANIFGPSGCQTLEGPDLKFPDPGSDVDRFAVQGVDFKGPNDKCTQATVPGGSYSSPPASGPTQTNAPPAAISSAPAPSAPAPSAPAPSAPAVTGYSSVGFKTSPVGSATAPQPAASEPVVTPVPLRASQAPILVPTSVAPPNTGSGSGTAEGTACTTEGQWNCLDGTSFQRCASGSWSSIIQLPHDTTCTPGLTEDLVIAPKKLKRSRHAMRRAHREYGHRHA